jgi:hypothetical protein
VFTQTHPHLDVVVRDMARTVIQHAAMRLSCVSAPTRAALNAALFACSNSQDETRWHRTVAMARELCVVAYG